MADEARLPEVSERGLWLGLLAGPLAWLTQLAVSYPLVPLSCRVEWGAIFHLVTLVTALAAVGAGTVAWQNWQQLRADERGDHAQLERQRFMALGGAISCALFLATIVAQWLPVLFIGPCA
jgi:hypothetical protein